MRVAVSAETDPPPGPQVGDHLRRRVTHRRLEGLARLRAPGAEQHLEFGPLVPLQVADQEGRPSHGGPPVNPPEMIARGERPEAGDLGAISSLPAAGLSPIPGRGPSLHRYQLLDCGVDESALLGLDQHRLREEPEGEAGGHSKSGEAEITPAGGRETVGARLGLPGSDAEREHPPEGLGAIHLSSQQVLDDDGERRHSPLLVGDLEDQRRGCTREHLP